MENGRKYAYSCVEDIPKVFRQPTFPLLLWRLAATTIQKRMSDPCFFGLLLNVAHCCSLGQLWLSCARKGGKEDVTLVDSIGWTIEVTDDMKHLMKTSTVRLGVCKDILLRNNLKKGVFDTNKSTDVATIQYCRITATHKKKKKKAPHIFT